MLSISVSLFSFYCFCLCLSVCEREPNGSVRLIACEVHIFIAARFASSSLCGCVKQSVWSLACCSYSSAYSSELRLVHEASQPSSLSRVYTVFYWLTAPSRAEDASFIINSCKPLFERRVKQSMDPDPV